MSPQLELLHKYAKALSGRDFALLKEVLHPHTFAFTMTPKSMGIPVIEGAEAFVGAATGMLTPPKKVSMHIDEKEVLESGNRIWAATTFSGENAHGEPFSEELIFRGRTAEHDGKLVFTEVMEAVDPKEEGIMTKA